MPPPSAKRHLVGGRHVISCDAQSLRGRGGRRSVRDRQLAEDPRYVHARGLVAYKQLAADLAVGQAVTEQGQNLDLARRELEPLQLSIPHRVDVLVCTEVDPGTA